MALAGKIERREQLSCEKVLFSCEELRVRTLIRGAIDAVLSAKKKHCYTRTRLPGKP